MNEVRKSFRESRFGKRLLEREKITYVKIVCFSESRGTTLAPRSMHLLVVNHVCTYIYAYVITVPYAYPNSNSSARVRARTLVLPASLSRGVQKKRIVNHLDSYYDSYY